MSRGTPTSSAATTISATYASASAGAERRAEQLPGRRWSSRPGAACTHSSRAGSLGRVRPAGDRVGAADVLVDPADPGRGPLRGRLLAEADRGQVGGRGGQPADRVLPPVAVLVDPGHRERVQRLDQQRAQPGHRRGQVGGGPPGHAGRAEEAVVGGLLGHPCRVSRRRPLDQAGGVGVRILGHRRIARSSYQPTYLLPRAPDWPAQTSQHGPASTDQPARTSRARPPHGQWLRNVLRSASHTGPERRS